MACSDGGTASAIDTASSASGATSVTLSAWNFSTSQALEVVEGLAAIAAAVMGLAGRGPEFAQQLAGAAAAARTGHQRCAPQLPGVRHGLLGRGDTERAQLVSSRLAQPVAAP